MKDLKKETRYRKEDLIGIAKVVAYDSIKDLESMNEVERVVSFVDDMIERIDANEPPMKGRLVFVGPPPNYPNQLF